MRSRSEFFIVGISALALMAACASSAFTDMAHAAPDSSGAVDQGEITQAQPELPTESLTITTRDGKKQSFIVELARTERQQEAGEMFRKAIPADHGMLFLWNTPHESAMWMRNTLISLDIVYIDSSHHIHAIEENTIPLSEAVISSHGVVASVLELPGGTTERLGILVGDQIESPAFQVSHQDQKKPQ